MRNLEIKAEPVSAAPPRGLQDQIECQRMLASAGSVLALIIHAALWLGWGGAGHAVADVDFTVG